jgi:sodium borate transporter 11
MISNVSGHRENLNIEEIKQALFVNDRGIFIFFSVFSLMFFLVPIVRILAKTLQATTATETNWTYDQSWLALMCTSPSVLKRHVAIARLKNPCNLGRNCQEARFIVFILTPMKEKGTKNFLETGRTFATIFADIELRAKLLKAATQQEFISIIDVNSSSSSFNFVFLLLL